MVFDLLSIFIEHNFPSFEPKGQLISKADWRAVDSPKKQTDEYNLFAVKSKKANKTNSSVRFLGEFSRP